MRLSAMIDTVLWDNDGLLVDTEILFFEATRKAFARLRLVLTAELWSAQGMAGGRSTHDIAVSLGGEPKQVSDMIEERNRHYTRLLARPPRVLPQARETLTALRGRVRLAMVTGSHRPDLDLMHRDTGLLDFFEVIVTGEECVRAKPDPEPYRAATKRLGVAPANCLAVEDSPRGLASARAAGVACVVVPTDLTRGLQFPGAVAVERDVSAVLKHLPHFGGNPGIGGSQAVPESRSGAGRPQTSP